MWKVRGQRTKRKAWGYTVIINGKRVVQVRVEQGTGPRRTRQGYLAAKARKKSIDGDTRYVTVFESVFGAETPLVEITGARISR